MFFLKHFWLKTRYVAFIRCIFGGLARMGLWVNPYYVFVEGLTNGNLSNLEHGFDEYEVGFLGPQDMKGISAIPDQPNSEEKLLLDLNEGKKCFGVKYRGELVAYTWCDFNRFGFEGYQHSLKEDEACLCDAFTLMRFRGKGLAPYVRYQCYKELAKLGIYKLYSYSDCFNTPALRFKLKLNANLDEYGILFVLFKKWRYNLRLKKYRVKT